MAMIGDLYQINKHTEIMRLEDLGPTDLPRQLVHADKISRSLAHLLAHYVYVYLFSVLCFFSLLIRVLFDLGVGVGKLSFRKTEKKLRLKKNKNFKNPKTFLFCFGEYICAIPIDYVFLYP